MWQTAIKNRLKSANLMWPGMLRIKNQIAVFDVTARTGPPQMADHSGPTYFQPFMDHTDWKWKLDMLL